MTGIHGIVGRFHKDGSTEYRKGNLRLILIKGVTKWMTIETGVGVVDEALTRKDAMKRIEYLLS